MNTDAVQPVVKSTTEPKQGIRLSRLHELIDQEAGIRFVSLSSVDGRSISFMGESFTAQDRRIAAISSSFLGLSEAFTKEAGIGGTLHAAVAADIGTVITVRIPSRSRAYVLSVCADPSINMAIALRYALDSSSKLAQEVDLA